MYPTIFEILCDLRKYKINPNRFDKLWQKHRRELGKRVSRLDGKDICKIVDSPIPPDSVCVLECQSGNDSTTADNSVFKVSNKSEQENVQFSDQHDPYIYDVDTTMDPTRSLQDTNSALLQNFFNRPVKIHESEWSTSADLNFDINPWDLYFNNPRVANRLTNYALMKANLKVKIVLNGNGFQYGRMLVSYLPFDVFDQLTTMAALIREDLVQASQMPHVFLNPTTSTGGELKLPFFHYANYLTIPNSEWARLGQLYFRTLNQLKHANGATDVVTISVFAWAEDVQMSVLTSQDIGVLSPQSGEIEEANNKGTVSGPATAVAKYAAYLQGVPYIGPFATATEIGAGAVAAMAKIFGYCRPPITKAPEPYRPTAISSLAVTNVPDNAQKLTVDEKQELTIDPRISGLGSVDPLNIREIAKRESYLTTFSWNIGTSPDSLLWNSQVDPVIWANSGGGSAYHFPACAFATLPFQFWKGTMKFRFQIVASSFHKGRLRIVYDPNFLSDSTYLGYSEYNTNYLKIVDIAEEQDFTIEIGMAQETSFVEHHRPSVDSQDDLYSTTRFNGTSPGNGVVGVYVVNELTTPNSTVNNDIEINVFVSMGDDFEVAVPDSEFANFVLKPQSGELPVLAPQSGAIIPESQNTDELDAPQQAQTTIIGLPPADDPNLNKVFFGESIASFRPLLKRYTLWNTIPKLVTGRSVISGRFSLMPYFRGNVPGAVDSTALLADYNYVNTLLMHWVKSAYSGWRGSIRYKFIPRGVQDRADRIDIQRAPFLPTDTEYYFDQRAMPLYTDLNTARADVVQSTQGASPSLPEAGKPLSGNLGTTLAVNSVNGVLEAEVPYYSPYRFSPGKTAAYTDTQTFEAPWDFRVYFPDTETNSNSATYDIYAAVGEDFQTYFFTGLPRMYYEASVPSA